ncbi:antibiotic biosynthesis monooxygenase family protein [Nocardia sp. CA-151230]|uniref:antibiotic biosynthesis monooxygenase family protein n=1 Tax=Nocardia sp. CA-151230 TaxID=3239982 RepID=UPI003D8AAC81
MSIGFIGFHYPKAEHFEEFIDRARQMGEAMRSTPGFLSGGCWTTATPDGDSVVTACQFESPEAFQAAMTAARSLGTVAVFDKREQRPREIHTLQSQFQLTR